MDSSITPVMFITANVGSIFENPTVMLKIWTEEFLSTVVRLNPKFIALHCQEVGGKNYEHSTQPVEDFVKLLMDSEELRLFDKVRVFLDEDFSSAENFTALGNFYFIHESIKDLLIWDFKDMNFCTVSGKEVHTGSIEHVPIKEKSKFPQDLFPECKWSRKGFLRTRWNLNGSVFDLVNIHLFHDASNFIAMETSPSVYSVTRQRALEYTLDRFQNDSNGAVPFFLFGDFNFRTNTQAVIERLVSGLDPIQVQSPSSNDIHKLLYRKEGNEVVLTLGKKEFVHSDHQQLFIENAGEWLKEFDNEKDSFDGSLFEFPIAFPPSYPFEEDAERGSLYMTTRCPAWCDRVVLSSAAKNLVHDISGEKSIEYELMGRHTCMGDHKPVYLRANLINKAGIIEQTLNNVVNPFMLVLCACKLKKILNWQHDKRSTLSSHVNKSTRLAVVEENGSLTLFPDIPINAPIINGSEETLNQCCENAGVKNKFVESSNNLLTNKLKLVTNCRKKLMLEKGQAEDLRHSKCDCSLSNVSQFGSGVLSSSILKSQNINTSSDPKIKSKSESNLKSELFRFNFPIFPQQDCSSCKLVPVSDSSHIKSYRIWKSCSDFEVYKFLPTNITIEKEINIETNAETEWKENVNSVDDTLNVDSIIDNLDSDEALIVNVNHRNELDETVGDESSISSTESLSGSQRISISKLKLNKLSVPSNLQSKLTRSQLCDEKQKLKAVPLPCLNHHYKRLVKRVHSASMIENKRTIVLKKTETCHCITNSNETFIDIFGDEYRTRSSSISAPNHIHRNNRRMKLISDPILKTSLPRLTSHHSSSDEEWYEQILETESPKKWLISRNDPVNDINSVKSFSDNNIVSNDDDKHLSNSSTVDCISSVNHHSCSTKLKTSNEKLNFPSDCKLLLRLKSKNTEGKEKSCKSCNCCIIL